MARRGTQEWLDHMLANPVDYCRIWPFSTLPNGYPTFGRVIDGVKHMMYVHRYVCELTHGPAPDGHEAAHICNNRGCVNPRHVSWKTASANQLDRKIHGTTGAGRKLKKEQWTEIRALKGHMTQREIADLYGITFQAVSHLHRHKGY